MLRDRWLGKSERLHDVADGPFAGRKVFQDVSTPRFGDGVERVRGGGGAGHTHIIFLYGNVSRAHLHAVVLSKIRGSQSMLR
jgi:hypothetical protein